MMFCYQCQEAFKGKGCSERGSCGKDALSSNIMDLLLYTTKGICILTTAMRDNNIAVESEVNKYVIESLYTTCTACNFNRENLKMRVADGLKIKMDLYNQCSNAKISIPNSEEILWSNPIGDFSAKAATINMLDLEPNAEQRGMKEFVMDSLKGIACFMFHSMHLGFDDLGVHTFMQSVISDLTQKRISYDEWQDLILIIGQYTMRAMALLDEANTETFGHPEFSSVNLSSKNRPAILVCGEDIKDLKELLVQSEDSGIDVYTYSGMLAAHAYPEIRKHHNLAGHFGGSWKMQREEFPAFHGPILFTSNCIIPPTVELSYKDRMFTTNVAGYPGCKHIETPKKGAKDFSEIIALAKEFRSPANIEHGSLNVGFAHDSLTEVTSQLLSAYGNGYIKRFVMIIGDDGRSSSREYYSDLAKLLPNNTTLFTAGDVKFRFNKHRFGYMNGIPRLFDAGQIGDTYSLMKFVLELKRMLKVNHINELPIDYFVSWNSQRSMAVLCAILSLGIKGVKLGPTMPAFVTDTMAYMLEKHFGIVPITNAKRDCESVRQSTSNSIPVY